MTAHHPSRTFSALSGLFARLLAGFRCERARSAPKHEVPQVWTEQWWRQPGSRIWAIDNGRVRGEILHQRQRQDAVMTAWRLGVGPLLGSARRVAAVLLAMAALVVLVACSAAEDPPQGASSSTALDYNEADVVFARTMIPHGEQGATMSELVLEQKGLQPDVQALAVELRDNRGPETDRLLQWVAERGEPVAAEAKHDHGGGEDGIATPAQIYTLDQAEGHAAEGLYIEMMIKHHRGAVAAAREEIAQGKNPALVEFARMILQTREAQLPVLIDAAARPNPSSTAGR